MNRHRSSLHITMNRVPSSQSHAPAVAVGQCASTLTDGASNRRADLFSKPVGLTESCATVPHFNLTPAAT